MENHKKIAPGNPPKNYNKDKAIGLFICRWKDCLEVLRARIDPKGDVYIFYPFGGNIEHESFHVSGDYHVRFKKEKFVPFLGMEDHPLAFRTAAFKLRLTPCFCFRRGKNLNTQEIKTIVEKLIRFVPITNIKEVVSALEKEGRYRVTCQGLIKLLKGIKPFDETT